MRAVAAHDEHAGRGIHRRDDAKRRVGFRQRAARDLSGDEREVELARLEKRHVLARALGVPGLDANARLLRVHHLRERRAVERKPAARRGGSEDEREHELGHCGSMPACCTMRLYTSISLRTKRANSSGFIGAGCMPSLENCSRIAGSWTMAFIAAFSFCTTAAGVAAGAHIPNQSVTS